MVLGKSEQHGIIDDPPVLSTENDVEAATDSELLDLCDDKPASTDPVCGEDAAYILAGVTELLEADLPRAREEVWNNG